MSRNNAIICGLAAALLGFTGAAHAGKVTGVKAEPATIVAGTETKVTVDGEDENICGLRVEYGNGDVDVTKMSQGKDMFPRSFTHKYASPGTFTITAKGGRDGSTGSCQGSATTTITVTAPPPKPAAAPAASAAAAAAAAPAPVCPEGFVLNKASVNKKTGAFSCNAKKGAQLPSAPATCPAGTAYYTNTAGTLLGCKALPAKK